MPTLISGQTHRGFVVSWRQTPDANSPDNPIGTTTTIQVIFKNAQGQRYVGTGTVQVNGTGNVAPQFNYIPSVADYAALGVGEWFVQFKGTWVDTTIDFTLPAAIEILPAP